MFEGVQIAIGIAAAIASFFFGIGLAIGGWIGRAKRITWWGAGFVVVGVFIAVLVWVFIQKVDRDHRWEAQAREETAKNSPEVERLRWIEHADVIADFRQHVEHEHDLRFLSKYGLSFGTEFPGLTETAEAKRLLQEHGFRRIEAGSDIISGSEEMRLQQEITFYAIRYNAMLLGYLEREK